MRRAPGTPGRRARPPARGPVDGRLKVLVPLLVGFGLVMVYSASSALSMLQHGESTVYFTSQLTKAAIGLVLMFVVARIDYRLWGWLAKPMVWASVALLVVLVVPATRGLTAEINGARRWIALPGIGFQPLEVAKLAVVVWLAATVVRKGPKLDRPTEGLVPLLVVPSVMSLLLLLQPDYKGALLILGLAWTMLFLGGVRLRHLAPLAAMAVPAGGLALLLEPYRVRRIAAFVNPESDLQGVSYQIHQSLVSLGSGGMFGVGLGSSKQKFAFLPAAHNDFIFSIVGEELGLLGTLLVLATFLYIGWIGFQIARRAPDPFGYLLASGVTVLLLSAALINMGVATAVLPTTGLTLPFVSFGGTALIVHLIAVGILMSVSRDVVDPPPRRAGGGGGPLAWLARGRDGGG